MRGARTLPRPVVVVLWLGAVLLMAWPMTRLASYLAGRSLARLTPDPFATIDRPAANAGVGHGLVVGGRVVHETIRAPLWLLVSRAGQAWEPEAALDTASGAWERSVTLAGRNGTKYRLVVVTAPHPLPQTFAQTREDQAKERRLQDLLLGHAEEGAGRGTSETASLGNGTYPTLPANAKVVASVDVVLQDAPPFKAPLMKHQRRGNL